MNEVRNAPSIIPHPVDGNGCNQQDRRPGSPCQPIAVTVAYVINSQFGQHDDAFTRW
jgi:hypothetical protein